MNPQFRLSKTEILRGYLSFSEVLSRKAFVHAADMRCYYVIDRKVPPCLCTVGFAVKREKRAVRRNAARRSLRESYRLNKKPIVELCRKLGIGLRCVIMYSTPREAKRVEFKSVEVTMRRIITALVERISIECLGC